MGKFIVYSDLHMHNWEYGGHQTHTGYNYRLEQQHNFLLNLGRYCKEHNIKETFFCGDFFHTHGRVNTDALFLAQQGLRYIYAQGVSQFLLVGNHDVSRAFRDGFPVEPNSLEQFTFLSRVVSAPVIGKHLSHPNITISMIPFTENKTALFEAMAAVADIKTIHPHYLFLHQGVAQVPLGSGYLLDEILRTDMIPENITRAFTGHYHTHRDLGKLVIVGPPMQHTWADTGESGGVLVVDSDTGQFEKVQVHNKNPKFVNMDAGFISAVGKMGETGDLESLVRDNFIRVNNITANLEDAEVAKKAMINCGALIVELNFKEKDHPEIDKDEIKSLSINELLVEFEKSLDEHNRQIGAALRKGSYEAPTIGG